MVTTEYAVLSTSAIIDYAQSTRGFFTALELELAGRLSIAYDLITDLEVQLGSDARS